MTDKPSVLKSKLFWVGILYFAEGFPLGLFYDVFPVHFRGEIVVELTDSVDVSAARVLDRVEIPLDSIPGPEAGKRTYVGMGSFEVPPGRYHLIF